MILNKQENQINILMKLKTRKNFDREDDHH